MKKKKKKKRHFSTREKVKSEGEIFNSLQLDK